MVVLLDENLDHRLRLYLSPHEVFTVAFRGWSGLQNGTLLRTAEENGIQVFLTGDQTLAYEQNLAGRRIAIVVLSTIELPILRGYLAAIVNAIASAEPGSLQLLDCGTFRRNVT